MIVAIGVPNAALYGGGGIQPVDDPGTPASEYAHSFQAIILSSAQIYNILLALMEGGGGGTYGPAQIYVNDGTSTVIGWDNVNQYFFVGSQKV